MCNDLVGKDQEWALRLFKRSPLKQRKFGEIVKSLPALTGLRCLDLGSDNGVISYLLRQLGGKWYSADLNQETVSAIKSLVKERVDLIEPGKLPYPDSHFDLVVVVDLLEHLPDDSVLVSELARILKVGGQVVINVPNPKEGWLRRLRFMLGQTDQAHGHVRPGYTAGQLEGLFSTHFSFLCFRGYGRFFSEVIDTLITLAMDILKKGRRSEKGSVTTAADISRHAKIFKIYGLLYPFFKVCVWLDGLIPFAHNNMLIAVARRSDAPC